MNWGRGREGEMEREKIRREREERVKERGKEGKRNR